ncbi:MAG TPA: hypothetical protein VKV28_14385 [Candidatus Binataceae bacterium]|nr:hypothetical protein [Candidatus Binataceae bacterium]
MQSKFDLSATAVELNLHGLSAGRQALQLVVRLAIICAPVAAAVLLMLSHPPRARAQLAGAPQPAPTFVSIIPGSVPAPVVAPPAGVAVAPAPPALSGTLPTPSALPPLTLPQIAMATAAPTPAPRVYNCSCNGSASYTRWMGTVNASSYFQARENAVNLCLNFNFNRRPASPFIPPPVFAFFPPPPAPVAASEAEPGLPSLQAPGLSGFALLNSSRAIILALCQNCACS